MKKTSEAAQDSSWPLFLTAHALLTELIERRLAEADLPPLGWYDVLWALERAPEHRLRMSELAQHVVLTRSNLTRLADRLMAAGLLSREQDLNDRRGAYAVLTAEGKALRKKMWPHYSAAIGELYDSRLSAEEQRVLGSALRKLISGARS
ncbi:MarR family winged helix-turn-helix transcriptional regulator [Massilia endophytica]|uniref:MarR family winged helix-turn-helix transcriptional regulator n=1 Tax=Massilia endophytica TaxID=2899220 RepID=UPI001E602B6D|nr:MarR family transcriptional regulator [Massilia endophytica]UGQ45383.1 MarR family transcriptional regulator [Massilia endophytica]